MTAAEDAAHFDLAIIGAGPGGVVAAVTAAAAGCRVVLVDSADRPGGQYYRHAQSDRQPDAEHFHRHWSRFDQLLVQLDAYAASGLVRYLPQHSVFAIERDRDEFWLHTLAGDRERERRSFTARTLLLATGAADRQLPFPGWTKPGVVTAGGAQALLKGSHVAAGQRAVVAGSGPFLLAVADGLVSAGVDVAAVVEAGDPRRFLRDPVGIAASGPKVFEAGSYAASLARHRVPYLTRHAVVAAHGDRRVDAVTIAPVDGQWRIRPGEQRRLTCDLFAVGYGFTARVELPLELGCAVELSDDGGLIVQVGEEQQTSLPDVYAVGELTGIGGVDLSLVEGEIAAAVIAHTLGRRTAVPARRLARLRRSRARLRRFAAALASVHAVRDGWMDWSDDTTLVCRCEEVPLGRIRAAVTELGAADARGVKLLARPGMGWCQGQICGLATASITAKLQGRTVTRNDVVGLARRPLALPVPLDVLASFAVPDDVAGD
jgi:D-hydroxyproline dehydrogenase subunit alpha